MVADRAGIEAGQVDEPGTMRTTRHHLPNESREAMWTSERHGEPEKSRDAQEDPTSGERNDPAAAGGKREDGDCHEQEGPGKPGECHVQLPDLPGPDNPGLVGRRHSNIPCSSSMPSIIGSACAGMVRTKDPRAQRGRRLWPMSSGKQKGAGDGGHYSGPTG